MKITLGRGRSLVFEAPAPRKEGQKGATKKVLHTVSVPAGELANLGDDIRVQIPDTNVVHEYRSFNGLIEQYKGSPKPSWAGLAFEGGVPYSCYVFDDAPVFDAAE